jgi:hypothetical protein
MTVVRGERSRGGEEHAGEGGKEGGCRGTYPLEELRRRRASPRPDRRPERRQAAAWLPEEEDELGRWAGPQVGFAWEERKKEELGCWPNSGLNPLFFYKTIFSFVFSF